MASPPAQKKARSEFYAAHNAEAVYNVLYHVSQLDAVWRSG